MSNRATKFIPGHFLERPDQTTPEKFISQIGPIPGIESGSSLSSAYSADCWRVVRVSKYIEISWNHITVWKSVRYFLASYGFKFFKITSYGLWSGFEMFHAFVIRLYFIVVRSC